MWRWDLECDSAGRKMLRHGSWCSLWGKAPARPWRPGFYPCFLSPCCVTSPGLEFLSPLSNDEHSISSTSTKHSTERGRARVSMRDFLQDKSTSPYPKEYYPLGAHPGWPNFPVLGKQRGWRCSGLHEELACFRLCWHKHGLIEPTSAGWPVVLYSVCLLSFPLTWRNGIKRPKALVYSVGGDHKARNDFTPWGNNQWSSFWSAVILDSDASLSCHWSRRCWWSIHFVSGSMLRAGGRKISSCFLHSLSILSSLRSVSVKS